ncbi:DUF5110 domain-containing protein [Prevotella sp. A2931]|uniref:DUF5110 domain-containing protein n=1 Tax=Prevotella illustrans TaxID=2800387 RepID=A0ABS3M271_9BACT|nr:MULTISPECIES: glycoside hydrolase family 31 protein [Prevotella]MBO1362289.1 DUF5110 domain-containing protein [Prevotella illustrans]PTL26459.1 alpha-xylosidase [Prevotella sp. oral taxon 820]
MKKLSLLCILLWGSLLQAAAISVTNPIVLGNNRLTLITPTLFRLEYSTNGTFVDAPTYFAYDRKSLLRPDEIEVKELGDDIYEIRTKALRIRYKHDGYPFSTSNLNVFYLKNGKEAKFTNRFILRNNLGGPVETLDRVTHEIPMNDGILSKDGWYMIDDARSDLIVNGWLRPRDTKIHLQDQYCFVYGNDYKAALRSLGAISGRVPMTRKYIHGVWYCRYWDYTSDEFLDIIRGYDKHDFPLDNLVFDMGWHTNDATTGAGHNGLRNWTGYTWNRKLIPDPRALLDAIHRQHVYVALNDHPHDGIRSHEECYGPFMRAMGAKPGDNLLFNPADSVYMRRFFEFAHHPSERVGVDFWWLDWQQNYLYPYVRGTNTTTLAWINELYYRDSERNGLRGCGYSRWAGWGDHRHPIQFSGDAQANWDILAFEVKLTAGSGNGGCYYWAHDIGGFRGQPNPELTTRWTQFGALSAALRVHSTKDPKLDRRPWLADEANTNAMRRMYHMRSRLMPYIYSCVWQTHNTMLPLNRSLFIDYGAQKESFENAQEFTFGDLILAAPITSPGMGADKRATQTVWFPKGETWYDYFTAERFEGGQTRRIEKPLDEFPMYVRGGWLLPMQPYTNRPASARLDTLVMRLYSPGHDADNSFTLYEDDGLTLDYTKGHYATTQLQYTAKNAHSIVKIHPTKGEYKEQTTQRAYRLRLFGFDKIKQVKVNGRSVKPNYDTTLKCYVVNADRQSIRQGLKIEF